MPFKCGHRRIRTNIVRKRSRGEVYDACRTCQNAQQRAYQRRTKRRTGKTQWARRTRAASTTKRSRS